MASPLKALRVLKLWQAGTLAAVLIGAAGATYGTYALLDGTGQSGLGENQQLIPVQLGDLVNQVSTNGSIIFPNRETLNFGTQGTVGDVLVEEGQHVEDGQELARLDETTVASLERAVAQARINLQDAQDALANAKDPHTPLDVAQAEANVANAKLSLQNAGDDLASLMEPASQDMAQADARVAESRLALGDAQDALDRLLTPTSQDLAQAEARVADARLALGDAQDALDRLLKPTSQDLAQAEARVADSRLALEDSRDALDRLLTPTSQDLAQVEARVADAKLALDNAEDALAGLLEPSSQQIAQVEVAVVNAGISVEDAQEALDAVRSGPNDEDITKAQGDVDSAGLRPSTSPQRNSPWPAGSGIRKWRQPEIPSTLPWRNTGMFSGSGWALTQRRWRRTCRSNQGRPSIPIRCWAPGILILLQFLLPATGSLKAEGSTERALPPMIPLPCGASWSSMSG